jgi:hypothetical protein
MAQSISRTEKKSRGRPRKNPTSIHVTLLPDQLAALDAWIEGQDDGVSRPEAIRRLIELGLSGRTAKIPRILTSGDALTATASNRPGAARATRPKKTRQRRS